MVSILCPMHYPLSAMGTFKVSWQMWIYDTDHAVTANPIKSQCMEIWPSCAPTGWYLYARKDHSSGPISKWWCPSPPHLQYPWVSGILKGSTRVSFTDASSHMDSSRSASQDSWKLAKVMVVYHGHPWPWLVLRESHCNCQVQHWQCSSLSCCSIRMVNTWVWHVPMASQPTGSILGARNMSHG